MARGMLRNPADRRTIAFTGIFFALVAAQWNWGASWSPWVRGLVLSLTCVFGAVGAVATHNLVHTPVFRNRTLNNWFRLAVSMNYGTPVSVFLPVHNLSHHEHTQTRRDITRTHKSRFRWNLLNVVLAGAQWSGAAMKADIAYFKDARERGAASYRQMRFELIGFVVLTGALLVLDPVKTLLYVIIPQQAGQWFITSINFIQHDGCDDDQTGFNHSRNFVGGAFNFLFYNNGYHTIHHMQPGLHWSKCPAAHDKKVKPYIHPALDQKSFVVYFFKAFILPGKRVTYLGEPFEPEPAGEDEPFLSPVEEARAVA